MERLVEDSLASHKNQTNLVSNETRQNIAEDSSIRKSLEQIKSDVTDSLHSILKASPKGNKPSPETLSCRGSLSTKSLKTSIACSPKTPPRPKPVNWLLDSDFLCKVVPGVRM